MSDDTNAGVDAMWDTLPTPGEPVAPANADTLPMETASEAPAEPTTDAEPETEAKGPARGADGKFVKAAPDEPETAEDTPAEEATDAEPAEAEAAPEPTPWAFKLDDNEIEVPGATLAGDGKLVIEGAENIELVSKFLGKGQKLDGYRERVQEREQQLRAEFLQKEATYQVERARWEPLTQRFDQLLGALEGAKEPEAVKAAVDAWVYGVLGEMGTIRGEMELAEKTAKFEAAQRAAAPPPEQVAAQQRAAMQETLGASFADLRRQAWAAHLTSDDWRALGGLVSTTPAAYFVEAPADFPEQGIVKGELVLNEAALAAQAQHMARIRAEARATQQQKAAVQAVNAKKAAPAAKVGTPTPPTKAPARPGQPSGTTARERERTPIPSDRASRLKQIEEFWG